MNTKTLTITWDECSRCGTQIERGSDGHIFCFFPSTKYTYEITGRYCKACTTALFGEMDLEILLKELTHLSLNFELGYPILMKKLNNQSEGYYKEDQELNLKGPVISDNGSNVTNCDLCRKYIYYDREPKVFFIEGKEENISTYCRECCQLTYRKMSLLEMVKEMMSGAIVQEIGFEVLKERLKERET